MIGPCEAGILLPVTLLTSWRFLFATDNGNTRICGIGCQQTKGKRRRQDAVWRETDEIIYWRVLFVFVQIHPDAQALLLWTQQSLRGFNQVPAPRCLPQTPNCLHSHRLGEMKFVNLSHSLSPLCPDERCQRFQAFGYIRFVVWVQH